MHEYQKQTERLCVLPGNPLAPAAARKFLRTALDSWGREGLLPPDMAEHLSEDALILVSELVTNAVVHAGTAVRLACRWEEDSRGEGMGPGLLVEVSDHHPARSLMPGELDTSGAHGRGLQLVTGLARNWGVSYGDGLKTVWFWLPTAEAPGGRTETPAVSGPAKVNGSPALDGSHPPACADAGAPRCDNRGTLSFLAEASDLSPASSTRAR
ncbi:ATP-binding protein [Streptomyces mirabilis]|uniref:ATP-binding protein n=1 Tax=Streptomyces mirabilis TaxID=68239 RepID=UPI0036D97873